MRLYFFLILLTLGCISETTNNTHTVNIRLGADLNYINPLLSGSSYARQVEQLIYLPLCQFDPTTLELQPVLAKALPEIEQLENGRVKYTFEIREEATWSDGVPITASDYDFTFKLIFNPELRTDGYRAYLSFLDSIVVDPSLPQNISIYTNKTYHLAATILSNIELFPKHIFDSEGVLEEYDLKKLRNQSKGNEQLEKIAGQFENKTAVGTSRMVGSGPYDLVAWEEKEHVILERKEAYWGTKIVNAPRELQAQSQRLNFKIIPNRQTAFQALKSGGIDIMNETPPAAFQEIIEGKYQEIKEAHPSQFLYYYIAMNPSRKALSTPELRKALSHAFDNQQWIDQQLFGLATPITNPISPHNSFYDKTLKPLTYDPDLARSIFEKNGFVDQNGDGILEQELNGEKEQLRFELAYSVNNPTASALATFFAAKARAAGVEILAKPLDFTALRKTYASGEYDLVFLASGAPPGDYDPQQSWHTKSWGKGNFVRFGNEETDAIIENICTSLDPDIRTRNYLALQRAIYADCPFIFLYSPQQTVTFRNDLQLETAKVWPGFVCNTLQ